MATVDEPQPDRRWLDQAIARRNAKPGYRKPNYGFTAETARLDIETVRLERELADLARARRTPEVRRAPIGPEPRRGMRQIVAVAGDWNLGSLHCPHCLEGFEAGQLVFESADQRTALHSECVLEMQADRSVPEIDDAYQESRKELLYRRSMNDE